MGSQSHWKLHEPVLETADFKKFLRKVQSLGRERLKDTYQTTFWYDFSKPTCWPEKVALELRKKIPKGKKIAGVEWWLSRMKTTRVMVDFHQDCDEKLAARTGKIVNPQWSSVFFLNRCRGGMLALSDDLPNEDNPALAPDRIDVALVAPKPNRFVVFEGTLTHGVLDANNEIPTGDLRGSVRMRVAAIFNWWHRCPTGVRPWSESKVYRGLAL